ncbi:alpha/beta hydrolase [Oceanicoccus sp. KOV_DT_Chl]|uniref:alpha/beta hydrolase n=1 Tax=Oceanicoccus sp. KOV_DT_Chl TaxID=1904639 RepID=UPI0011AF4CB6|nr:alpha/beta hydrolase fold domain-containing protein [Oceanicoccus sp. KOV_DT_Chl]
MPSTIYQSIIDTLDGSLTSPTDNLATARDKMNAVHGHPIDATTQAQWIEYGGVRCALVTAAEVTDFEQYLIYFHGGAFIAADGDGFLFYAEMLSRNLNVRVVMVDYRLAPTDLFPAALDDCCNAYLGMLANDIPASSIAMIGDSCGGGLVLSSLLKLRDKHATLPCCAITLCGWFDVATDNNNQDPLYHQSYCHQRGLDYAGDEKLDNPLISPVFAHFQQLPPLLLQAGSVDPTAEQANIIYQKILATGGVVELDISEDMLHGFHGLANLGVPESLAALARAKIFCKRYQLY